MAKHHGGHHRGRASYHHGHRHTGSHHSHSDGYNVKLPNFNTHAPEMSTPNKIDPGKHHQASYRAGLGAGHGTGHTPKGPLGGITRVKARTGV